MTSNDYRDRLDELSILELATAIKEDEFGNIWYTFATPMGVIELHRSLYDGDTAITLVVPGQSDPVVLLELVGCEGVVAVNDKRGKYLEFVGQHKVEDYARGELEKTAGFRVRFEPFVRIEPFYLKS